MTSAQKYKLMDLIEDIKKVDRMISLHSSDSSAMMLEQYKYKKDKLISYLIDEFVEITKGRGSADSHPIRIDKMIEILQSLKSDGCSHVEIEYHCDHIGYDISGSKIEKSSSEDIESYEEKIAEKHLSQISLGHLLTILRTSIQT